VCYWNLLELDAFEATDVDCSYDIAIGIDALAVGMHATLGTEAVFDGVLVERVSAGVLVWRQKPQLVARDEPHERALALADGAIAGRGTAKRSFNLECNAPAVAASLVKHVLSPGKVAAQRTVFCNRVYAPLRAPV
jgi:hypothetical protein